MLQVARYSMGNVWQHYMGCRLTENPVEMVLTQETTVKH